MNEPQMTFVTTQGPVFEEVSSFFGRLHISYAHQGLKASTRKINSRKTFVRQVSTKFEQYHPLRAKNMSNTVYS